MYHILNFISPPPTFRLSFCPLQLSPVDWKLLDLGSDKKRACII